MLNYSLLANEYFTRLILIHLLTCYNDYILNISLVDAYFIIIIATAILLELGIRSILFINTTIEAVFIYDMFIKTLHSYND